LSPDAWYKKAQTVWANNRNGNSFEATVREYLGSLGKGSKPSNIGGFIPDLPVNSQFGVMDIKNVEYLTNSDQLRAFYNHAIDNELPFNLIISPKTNSISSSVLEQIRTTNGSLFEFNANARTLSPVNIGTEGFWRR
jgi:hypothetical protein